MARRQGGGMTVAEAGRMGGRLVSEKYGPEFYEKIGKKGGKAVTAKYGPGHFEKIGRKGGQKVADLIERAKSLENEHPEPLPRESNDREEKAEEREETAAG